MPHGAAMLDRNKTVRNAISTILLCALLPIAVAADEFQTWPVVSDSELGQLRGGLNVGPMIANFAIERIVRIDGEIVARTLLVVDFSNVGKGGLPTFQVIGNLANLIQVGLGNSLGGPDLQPVAAVAAANEALTGASPELVRDAIASVAETATQAAGSLPLPMAADSSNSTVTAAAGIASGSEAQFGTALAQAIDAVTSNGATSAVAMPAQIPAPMAQMPAPAPNAMPSASTVEVGTALVAQAVPAAPSAPAVPVLASAPATPATPSEVAAASSIVRSVGSTGQVIVISNLPDASSLATAIQNSVAGTRLETQTTINATLNSLSMLQSGALADVLRQQILESLGRP